ncbi:hypothetical protein [Nocardia xishanensis]
MGERVTYQDEDLWVVPQEWWGKAQPFRGVNDPEPRIIDPAGAAALRGVLDIYRRQLEESLKLTRERGEVTIADAGEAYLAAPEEHRSSLGAAAIWILVDRDYDTCHCGSMVRHSAHLDKEIRGGFVDGWIAAHGYAFAAEAALRCHELTCDTEYDRRLGRQIYPLRFHDRDSGNVFGMFWSLAAPLRARLASAPDPEYHTVVQRLSEFRADNSPRARVATSYLLPEQREWVEADLTLDYQSESQHPASVLASALTTPNQFAPLLAMSRPYLDESTRHNVLTQIGVAATPLFVDQFQALHRKTSAGAIREWAQLLTHFPTDDAYRALLGRADWKQVAPALTKATTRYPRRAMRLLSEHLATTSDPVVEQRLRLHALAHPDLVAECVHPGATHLLKADERLPEAPSAELSAVLATPPWHRSRPATIPIVTAAPHRPLTLSWAPGESERFRDSMPSRQPHAWVTSNWEHYLANAISRGTVAALLVDAAPEHARKALRTIRPAKLKRPGRAVAALLGRYQQEAVEFAVAAAFANPATTATVLMPIDGTDISHSMMRWLRSKTVRHIALEWFDRHASTAVSDVVAAALSATGKDRSVAEDALRELAERGHLTAIDAAAETFGPAAQSAVADVLHTDPLLLLPARMPALPDWLAPALLPQIRLRDSATALPETAVTHLLSMFMISGPETEYAGLRMATESLDPTSTTEFVAAVFDAWHLADYPGSGAWVLHALGLTGTDETVDRLAPLIAEWSANSAHARSIAGLDILVAIGTEKAVKNLHMMARQSRFAGLRHAASERLAIVGAGQAL